MRSNVFLNCKAMRKHIVCGILIAILAIGFFILVPAYNYVSLLHKSRHSFVTSVYSQYCYFNGSENGNIKVKIYYESLIQCGKPLKN